MSYWSPGKRYLVGDARVSGWFAGTSTCELLVCSAVHDAITQKFGDAKARRICSPIPWRHAPVDGRDDLPDVRYLWSVQGLGEARSERVSVGEGGLRSSDNKMAPAAHPLRSIREHLALKNPRFVCKDASEVGEVEVPISNQVGSPASPRKLAKLQDLAGPAFEVLAPLYQEFDGLVFHANGQTAGLVVAPIDELEELNREWRVWLSELDPADLCDSQRYGFAFATVSRSANYFIVYDGQIYYSRHDGGDDALWGDNLADFFAYALSDPVGFLGDAGCYTQYSVGDAGMPVVPERFMHD